MVLYAGKGRHSLACQHSIVSAMQLALNTEQISLIE